MNPLADERLHNQAVPGSTEALQPPPVGKNFLRETLRMEFSAIILSFQLGEL